MNPDQFQAAFNRDADGLIRVLGVRLLSYCRNFAMGTVARLVRANMTWRSGGFAGSFQAEPTGTPEAPGVSVFSTHPGARAQEEGATIRERGKLLTIPLPRAVTASGVTRGGARQWPDATTFVGRSDAGNLMLFLVEKRALVPLFLLRRQVTLRPRLGLMAAWDQDAPAREQVMREGAAEVLRGT